MKARLLSVVGILAILLGAGAIAAHRHALPIHMLGRRLGQLTVLTQPLRGRAHLSTDQRSEESKTLTSVSINRMPVPTTGIAESSSLAAGSIGEYDEKGINDLASEHLYVEKVETVEQLRALEQEWNVLHEASGNTLPFTTYTWAYHWWQHFRAERLAVRDSLSIFVVRNAQGAAVAIAPMMLTAYPGYGPLRLKFLQFLGADPRLTEVRGPLLHPHYDGAALRAMLDALESTSHSWAWIKWSGIQSTSAGVQVLKQTHGMEVFGELHEYVLALAPTWEEFRKGRKRNIRESLRHCYNSLTRDGHTFTFNVAETPEEIEVTLQRFFVLHQQRAKEAGTIAHIDYFASTQAQAFLQDVCMDMSQNNSAKVFTLSIGDKVVAARVGFVLNGSLYLYYSGYDPEWSKYSVMTTTVAEAIKYAIGQGLRTVSLSTGTDVSKTRWGPSEIVYNDFLHTAPSMRARLAYGAYSRANQVRNQHLVRQVAGRWLFRRAERS